MIADRTLRIIKSRRRWSVPDIAARFRISKEWALAMKDELVEYGVLEELEDWRKTHKVLK